MAFEPVELHVVTCPVPPARTIVIEIMIRDAQRHLASDLIQQSRVALIRKRPRFLARRKARCPQRDILRVEDAVNCAHTRADHRHQMCAIRELQYDIAHYGKLIEIALASTGTANGLDAVVMKAALSFD